jgi:stearoyl-CoA 9-desaturase NADPH oxidoreductase
MFTINESIKAMNLNPSPRALNWLHRLATPLVPDDYLELVNPLWSTRSLNARVVSLEAQPGGATTVTLQPPARWGGFRAGQFVNVSLSVNGIRQARCYSICSAPDKVNNRFDITVKAIDSGRVSNHVNRQLRVGDVVEISEAQGEFTWGDALPPKALFISAGSGITPLMGMALEAAASGVVPDLVWLHYAPEADQVIFGDTLAGLQAQHPQLNLQVIYTRKTGEHFSGAALMQRCPDWRQRSTWACGPGTMLDAAVALWDKAPDAKTLTIERFQPKIAKLADLAAGGQLAFADTGCSVTSDGSTSILEVAEAAGLSPKYGCRMGICHGCTVALKAGQVRDLRTGQVFGEEDDLIQICVCAPAGDVAVAL